MVPLWPHVLELSLYTSDEWSVDSITKFLVPLTKFAVVRATHDTIKKYFRPDGKFIQLMVPTDMVKKDWDQLRLSIFENVRSMLLIHL